MSRLTKPTRPSMMFTVALMVTSIILLLVLQGFWLRSVYNDQRRDLERDVSILFGNTVIEMSDSLMQQSIKALPPGDSTGKVKHKIRVNTHIVTDSLVRGSTFVKREYRDSGKNIQVFLYSDKGRDSIRHYLRPLLDQFREQPPTQAFTIRLTGDSLRIHDIKTKFNRALADAGIRLPDGTIKVTAADPRTEKRKDTIFTPTGAFTAEFVDVKWIVFKKITPQI
ncbi:MAG TPA: hypothetical protein VG737_18400, partial [Cyclobacteriaceae bacterium]|nr:hypothetical protein [Cyclobacteriaceae bacterium]